MAGEGYSANSLYLHFQIFARHLIQALGDILIFKQKALLTVEKNPSEEAEKLPR